MDHFMATLQAETVKVYKSKVVWLTAAAFTIAPIMASFFMFVLKNPEVAQSSGLLGEKAKIAGAADWPAYLNLHAQMIAVGGIFVFGFTTSWIFGREYADNTVKDLLALPYSRAIIVLSKFTISFITNLTLSIYIVLLGFLLGWIVGLPEWSSEIIINDFYTLLIVTILTIMLSTPIAFLASVSRGYLAPLGFVILTLVLSQIIAAIGYGEYLPWAIPALYSGLAGESFHSWSSLVIIFMTSMIGCLGTIYWWIFADQH